MISDEYLTQIFQCKLKNFLPFHHELIHFCESLSQALFQYSINNPKEADLVALAFWLRKTNLYRMQQYFQKKAGLLVPRGLVFHIPPANIDVMLVYSWITSLLVGNSNIIRIPTTRNLRADKLLQIIFNLLEKNSISKIKEMNFFIEYGHDDRITSMISSQADVRIIWGGDETIETIRKIPLQSSAIDLAFPDRFSFGAINANAYLQEKDPEKVSTKVFNDIYWFEQSACSSPRLLFWVGTKDSIEEASNIFYNTLQEVIDKRKYRISLGGVLLKKTYLFNQSLVLPVEKAIEFSNELSVLYLSQANENCRIHCGQGLLYHVPITKLDEIASFTTHKDQTLTHYGFSEKDLQSLTNILNGKGITRMVPFGQALNFEPVWDGHDLFDELTQHDAIRGDN